MKKTTQFDDYLNGIRRELVKLEKSPGTPLARRNARRRVLSAARLLRAAVDREYPSIIERAGVKRLKTFNGRKERLERAGWEIIWPKLIPSYVAAGVTYQADRSQESDSWRQRRAVHNYRLVCSVVGCRHRTSEHGSAQGGQEVSRSQARCFDGAGARGISVKIGDYIRVKVKGSADNVARVEGFGEGYFTYRMIDPNVRGVFTGFAALRQEGTIWWKCDAEDVRAFLTACALTAIT